MIADGTECRLRLGHKQAAQMIARCSEYAEASDDGFDHFDDDCETDPRLPNVAKEASVSCNCISYSYRVDYLLGMYMQVA